MVIYIPTSYIVVLPIMKKENIPDLKRKVYRLMPISQATLYKKLNLSSQDGARLVSMMIQDKVLKRKQIIENNRVTYMLMRKTFDDIVRKLDTERYKPLINHDVFSPCTGCPSALCKPETCLQLDEWVHL